jgi:hypothetical protein
MICPACQLELGVERQAGEVVLRYSIKRYHRGDPVLCANLMPSILELLPEKATPFRSVRHSSPTKDQ